MTQKKPSGADRIPTTRDAQREETRGRLIAITIDALNEGGEQAVKVGEIAAKLEISVGAVYHHFENREGLIVAARIAQFEDAVKGDIEALREIVERVETRDEYRTEMRVLINASQSEARAANRQLRAELAGVARHSPDLAAALAVVQSRCTDGFTDVMRRSQEKGLGNPDVNPRAAAIFAQALSLGLVLDDLNTVDPLEKSEWYAFTDVLYDALLAPE